MGAVDPTYPLYPIACLLSSVMLLLVLTTSFVRQSWNLGVAFLCLWLFLELVTESVNAIIWSDNADIKLFVYCDIVSHLQEITFVVKPMATLIITRRLYLISSLQSVELPSKAAKRWDLAIEWTLGLTLPVLVAGPVYYVNQGARFLVFQGFGCGTAGSESILDILIEQSWGIVPPLISIIFYYPKVARTYYRQRKDINSFLRSNSSVSPTNYLRILVLASIDILLTLPIGIVNITLSIVGDPSVNNFPFYPGWTFLHTDWEPASYSYAEQQAIGTASLAQSYFASWSSPVLAFTIFGLFGVTPEARASFWHIICTVGGWFGWKPTLRARNGNASLGDIQFGPMQPHDTSGFDLEMGPRPPSFINTDAPATNQDTEHISGRHTENESEMDLKSVEEALRKGSISDAALQDVDGSAPAVQEMEVPLEKAITECPGPSKKGSGAVKDVVGGSTTRERQSGLSEDAVDEFSDV